VGGRFVLFSALLFAAPVEAAPARCKTSTWRYALVTSLYAPVEDVTRADYEAAWRANKIAASETTKQALGLVGGITLAADARPELAPDRWAIVPAHALSPGYRVITVDGKHPLDREAGGLVAEQCGAPNIDPAKLTTIAMTGTSALTRFTGQLIDKRGVEHVTRDVEPWLRGADFVHISHEVAFSPKCDLKKTLKGSLMCAREDHIAALEASHAKIIELTGSHLADFGKRWVTHTLEMYEARGWVWFGGGRNQAEATAPRIVEHAGNRIAFLGCNEPQSKQLGAGPGPAACDFSRMAAEVAGLRQRGIVPIVSIQHEEVYTRDPPDSLVRDFRRLAEAGAALVFGSQAHVAHPWEVHHGAFVHYGAGNFLFDQQFKITRDAAQDMLYVHDGKLLCVGQLFTRIVEWGKPRPMLPAERLHFLAVLQKARKKLPAAKPWLPPRALEVTAKRRSSRR
jgi:Bacterial capsule synthesis protein PGA_cap